MIDVDYIGLSSMHYHLKLITVTPPLSRLARESSLIHGDNLVLVVSPSQFRPAATVQARFVITAISIRSISKLAPFLVSLRLS